MSLKAHHTGMKPPAGVQKQGKQPACVTRGRTNPANRWSRSPKACVASVARLQTGKKVADRPASSPGHGALRLLAGLFFIAGMQPSGAQTPPDAGSIQRQIERQQPQQPRLAERNQRKDLQDKPAASELTHTIRKVRFNGNTLVSKDVLSEAIKDFLNVPLDFQRLQELNSIIARVYKNAGFLARVFMPEQDITAGELEIRIVESVYGGLKLEGEAASPIERQLIESFVDHLLVRGQPMSAKAVDRAILLSDDLPGTKVSARLGEGGSEGETLLILSLSAKRPASGAVIADNAGSRSSGIERLTVNLDLGGLGGLGESVNVVALHSRGSDYVRASATRPIAANGLRFGIHASSMNYKLIDDTYKALGARGTSSILGFEFQYPIVREADRSVYAKLGVERKRFDNLLAGDAVGATASVASPAYSSSNHLAAGSYRQTVNSLTGADAGNYTVASYVTPTVNYVVLPLPLQFSGIDAARSTYGTTPAGGTVHLANVLGSDDVMAAASVASPAYSSSGQLKAGSYKQTASALGGTDAGSGTIYHGADVGNYIFQDQRSASAKISPRNVVVRANDDTRYFTGAEYTGGNGVVYEGLAAGEKADVLSGTLVYAGSSQGAVSIGAYLIHPDGISGSNYFVTLADGVLKIVAPPTPASLPVYNQTAPTVTQSSSAQLGFGDVTAQAPVTLGAAASSTQSSSQALTTQAGGTQSSTPVISLGSAQLVIEALPSNNAPGVAKQFVGLLGNKPEQEYLLSIPRELTASGGATVDVSRLPSWMTFDSSRQEFRLKQIPGDVSEVQVELLIDSVRWTLLVQFGRP
jgi:hypothetical protein